jgi:ribosome biogenesis protein MAK21
MLRSLELGVEQTSKQKPKGESKTKGTRLHTPKAKATRTKTILQEPRPPQNPPSSKPLLPPSSKWYTLVPTLTPLTSKPLPPLTPPLLSDLQKRASALLTSAQSSPSATSSKSETSFFQNIIASGTLSDRLSALTLLVQGSPLHNLRALETLKGMAEKGGVGGGSSSGGGGGREVGLKALRCITDWWVGGGAPERKLKCVCFLLYFYKALWDDLSELPILITGTFGTSHSRILRSRTNICSCGFLRTG